MSSLSCPWMILWTVTEMSSFSAPSEHVGSIFCRRSSIVQVSRVSLCLLVWERKGCLATRFSFWLQSVILFAYSSVSEEDCQELWIGTHEVRKVPTSFVQEELHSPSGTEDRDLVCPVDLVLLLSQRCHPQALGYVFHWPCGSGSAGCVTR